VIIYLLRSVGVHRCVFGLLIAPTSSAFGAPCVLMCLRDVFHSDKLELDALTDGFNLGYSHFCCTGNGFGYIWHTALQEAFIILTGAGSAREELNMSEPVPCI
jgi:hypothetical protein